MSHAESVNLAWDYDLDWESFTNAAGKKKNIASGETDRLDEVV